MNRRIEAILEKYRDEMTEKLQELIRIESVTAGEDTVRTAEAPYGEETRKALDYMIKLAESKGFECTNYDYHACELNFGERKEDAVGIVSHLDVVPAGGTWKYPPFSGELHDGRIYGRGAVDDKGPAIASFYAALAIKESGLPLNKNITQILGCNEEGGAFPCIRHYLETADRIPSCGIVPDSYYPICFSEKHFANVKLTASAGDMSAKAAGRRLISIAGGEAINAVPARAEAVLEAADGKGQETVKKTGMTAHASTPEQGDNAIAKLINEMAGWEFEPAAICDAIKDLSKLMGRDTDGTGLGIDLEDETGRTTNNMGLITYEDGVLTVESNMRLPLSMDRAALEDKMEKAVAGTGFDFELTYFIDGFYIDPEEEPACTLIDVYREETGEMESQPFANGSGSYARIMDHFVPFGIARQDEALMFHVEDESITTERLFESARIYAEALYRLAVK